MKELKIILKNKNETTKSLNYVSYSPTSMHKGIKAYPYLSPQYSAENYISNNMYGQYDGNNKYSEGSGSFAKFVVYVPKVWSGSLNYPQEIPDTQQTFIDLVKLSFLNTKYLIGNYNKHYVSRNKNSTLFAIFDLS